MRGRYFVICSLTCGSVHKMNSTLGGEYMPGGPFIHAKTSEERIARLLTQRDLMKKCKYDEDRAGSDRPVPATRDGGCVCDSWGIQTS